MRGFWRIAHLPEFDELPTEEQDRAYKYVALRVLRRWQFWATFLNFNACLVGGLYVGRFFGSGEPGDIVREIAMIIGVGIGGGLSGALLGIAAIKYARLHAPEYMKKRKKDNCDTKNGQ